MKLYYSAALLLSLTTSNSSAFVPATRSLVRSSLFAGRTLYDKIWDDHVVDIDGTATLLYIDRHLVHEVTSPQAFDGLHEKLYVVPRMLEEM